MFKCESRIMYKSTHKQKTLSHNNCSDMNKDKCKMLNSHHNPTTTHIQFHESFNRI